MGTVLLESESGPIVRLTSFFEDDNSNENQTVYFDEYNKRQENEESENLSEIDPFVQLISDEIFANLIETEEEFDLTSAYLFTWVYNNELTNNTIISQIALLFDSDSRLIFEARNLQQSADSNLSNYKATTQIIDLQGRSVENGRCDVQIEADDKCGKKSASVGSYECTDIVTTTIPETTSTTTPLITIPITPQPSETDTPTEPTTTVPTTTTTITSTTPVTTIGIEVTRKRQNVGVIERKLG